jgi:hypothetical protein
MNLDCEWSLVSAGLNFRACERKGGTADNTSRNKISVAHTTQNSHWSKSICLSIKCSNYAINNFQTDARILKAHSHSMSTGGSI